MIESKFTSNPINYSLLDFYDKYTFDDVIEPQDVKQFIDEPTNQKIKKGTTVAVKIEDQGVSRYFLTCMAESLQRLDSKRPHLYAEIERNGAIQTICRTQIHPLKNYYRETENLFFEWLPDEEKASPPQLIWNDYNNVRIENQNKLIDKILSSDKSIFHYLMKQRALGQLNKYIGKTFLHYHKKAARYLQPSEALEVGKKAVKLAVYLRDLDNDDLLYTYQTKKRKLLKSQSTGIDQVTSQMKLQIYTKEIERRGLDFLPHPTH